MVASVLIHLKAHPKTFGRLIIQEHHLSDGKLYLYKDKIKTNASFQEWACSYVRVK